MVLVESPKCAATDVAAWEKARRAKRAGRRKASLTIEWKNSTMGHWHEYKYKYWLPVVVVRLRYQVR